MRIAVVSDIHGNWTALQAVIADLGAVGVDLVVHGGDLAANGSRPAEVIDLIRHLDWPGVVGNTDEMLWAPERLAELATKDPQRQPLREVLFKYIAPWTRAAIGDDRLQWFRSLPTRWRGDAITVVHASPNDLWRAPLPGASCDELEGTYGDLGVPLVIYGHIHRPYVRQLRQLVVANSGSVSLSYDGDRRAAYLLIEDGRPVIRRVEYDIEREIRDLAKSHCPYRQWLAAMLASGTYIQPSVEV
jgi:putative phosphoesterase